MKKILTLIMLCVTLALQAQDATPTPSEMYATANSYYADTEYAQAAELYEAILLQEQSAEVYYNLGNAYFKMGELAQSILAYERALRINPQMKDAQHNLQFAQSRIVDNMEDNTTFFLSQWTIALRNLLHQSTWMWLSIGFFVLCLVGAIGFAFLHSIGWRKASFHTAWIALLFTIVCGCFAGSLHSRDTKQEEAIITQSIVNAKSSPDKSGTDLFVLHEGTKVHIRSTLTGWVEISVGNHVGWISQTALERI